MRSFSTVIQVRFGHVDPAGIVWLRELLRHLADAQGKTILVSSHVLAEVAQTEQVWTADGWSQRFRLPFAPSATGYGHDSDDVAAVQVRSGELLTGYHDAVHDMTIRYVEGLTDADFDRIVDRSWDPPVTLAVRLVSVISDDLQHAGQAAFIAGVLSRRPGSGA